MKQYKGYYVDGVIFKNEEQIDQLRKETAINQYMSAVEIFLRNKTNETALYTEKQAVNLVNNFGFTWEQIDEMEIEIMKNIVA